MGGSSNQAEESSGDFLGYGVYAQTLWARVVRALNKDASGLDASGRKTRLGDDPLVVGIFGEWGAGKSKLLSLVMEQAEHQSARDISERILGSTSGNPMTVTVPVYFQPWKYEHERHLHVPLAVHVAEALNETWKKLPTDIEKLKGALTAAGETLEKATELAEGVSENLKRAKGLFDGAIGALQSRAGAVVAGTTDVMLTAVGAPPLASVARRKILGAFGHGDTDESDAVDPDGGEEPEVTDGTEMMPSRTPKSAVKKEKTAVKPDDAWAWKDNGLGFYHLHQRLQALTRPKLNQKLLKDAGIEVTPGIEFDLRINFVVFVDDLDRCLPEKAVETLELIKTVFNLESFAFVLALDEEVVERGIGYRYKDYALQNKKPEMPITGFEYLEKIIHLPFRLPGLTKHQARRFLERYESEEVAPKQPERWWFAPHHAVEDEKESRLEEAPMRLLERNEAANVDLSMMVLSAFTTYVPRKLVRLVELLHQVQEIALRRGKKLTGGGDSGADVRVMTALVMIQLFQPDLYRLVRRKPQALPLLLAAFAKRGSGYQDFSDPDISDVDLWLWVVEESAGKGNDWIQTCSISEAMNAVVRRISTNYHVVANHGLPVQYEVHNEDGEEVTVTEFDTVKTRQSRALSQNVKLPLVAHIVEHRAAQRHAFDPLRLMHALAGALETGWSGKDGVDVSPAASLQVDPYFSLMAPLVDPHWELYFGSAESSTAEDGRGGTRAFPDVTLTGSGSTQVSVSSSGRVVVTQPVRFPDRLLADLVSEQTEVQANLLANNELESGKLLEITATRRLLSQLREWRKTNDQDEHLAILKRGLQIIAPLVPRELGADFLELVDEGSKPPYFVEGDPEAFSSTGEMNQATERAELWSAFGQDRRFDLEYFYLPRERLLGNQDDTEREPIPGFVRVFEQETNLFQPFSGSAVSLKPYYMARYLTTVDQYAQFIAHGGYGDPAGAKPDWWDSLGWQWRNGQWDSQVENKSMREYLARRKPELRGAPMNWAEQRAHGSRPVIQLSWFEARAYAHWVTLQLKDGLSKLPKGYAVRLPTEAQWERAARTKDASSADERQYSWGGDDPTTAHLRANIRASELGRVSPVGLFAPNPLGLRDLSGNVWEWQNNLYRLGGGGQDDGLGFDVSKLETNDRPALRGGAWSYPADGARASVRFRNRPDLTYDDVGFRVVLSLPN